MCEPTTIGLILSAAGSGAGALNQHQALKAQDKEAARGIIEQSRIQRQANARVGDQIRDIDASTGQSEQAAALGDFQNAIRQNRAATEAGGEPIVGANDRFGERVGVGNERLKTAGQEMAERLATITGAINQRRNENQRIGRTGSDIDALSANSRGADFLARLRASGERANPFVDVGAGVLQGFGSALSQRVPNAPPDLSPINVTRRARTFFPGG